ncbi:hypothetical protein ACFVTT_25490 [Streptomyces niveus]
MALVDAVVGAERHADAERDRFLREVPVEACGANLVTDGAAAGEDPLGRR